MEERLLALLDKYDLRTASINNWQVLIQSFSADSLKIVHAMDPRLPLIFLGNPSVANIPSVREYAVGIGPSFGARQSTPTGSTPRTRNCLDVHPYTINDDADMNADARRRRRRHVHELRRPPDRHARPAQGRRPAGRDRRQALA